MVNGSGLNGGWRLALDSQQPIGRAPVTARLNGIPLQDVSRLSGNQLRIVVPGTLRAGSYDLAVQLGSAEPVRLRNALTIVDTPDTLDTPDSGLIGSPATATDAGARPVVDAAISRPDSGRDAAPAAAVACPPGQFGAAELVTISGVNTGDIWSPSLSSDHRTLYFAGPGTTGEAIWKATRTDRGLNFSNATRLPSLQSANNNGTPWISADNLSLYFYADPASGNAERDLFVSTRADPSAPFGTGQALTVLNSTARDQLPWLSPDALTIAFYSRRGGIGGLWTATRNVASADFNAPVELTELNSTADDGRLFISTDGLVAYFSSSRSGGLGGDDIWYAQRSSPQGAFSNVQNLTSVNSPNNESDVTLSSDGLEMFFAFRATGSTRFYRATAQCDEP